MEITQCLEVVGLVDEWIGLDVCDMFACVFERNVLVGWLVGLIELMLIVNETIEAQ